jgi:type II secretory pathway predicted ATPase ExeA
MSFNRRGSASSACPSGRLEMPLQDVADAVGLDYATLRAGIYTGRWKDAAKKAHVSNFIRKGIEAREGKTMLVKVTPSEEVLQFFNLKRDAFGEAESYEDLFETKALAAAERKILAAADGQRWLAVTGDVGAGKSTLLQRARARLAKRKDVVVVEPRVVQKENLKASHILDAILADLGTDIAPGRYNLEHRARHVIAVLEQVNREGKKALLVVDESHLLTDSALLTLKRLWEFKVGFKRLLGIVLVGQTTLVRRLKGNFQLTEVGQRVDCVQLDSLNGQTGHYVEFRLERAGLNGASSLLFTKDAAKALAKIAGTPLALNNLCNASLIRAHDLGERTINAEIVESAAAGL